MGDSETPWAVWAGSAPGSEILADSQGTQLNGPARRQIVLALVFWFDAASQQAGLKFPEGCRLASTAIGHHDAPLCGPQQFQGRAGPHGEGALTLLYERLTRTQNASGQRDERSHRWTLITLLAQVLLQRAPENNLH